MIANIVQSLFGAAYDWPLGAAISVCDPAHYRFSAVFHRTPRKALVLPMSATAATTAPRAISCRLCNAGIRLHLSAHHGAHRLFLQSRRRRRLSAPSSHVALVPPTFCRRRHLELRAEQPHRRGLQRRSLSRPRLARRSRARPRQFPGQITFPPPGFAAR